MVKYEKKKNEQVKKDMNVNGNDKFKEMQSALKFSPQQVKIKKYNSWTWPTMLKRGANDDMVNVFFCQYTV